MADNVLTDDAHQSEEPQSLEESNSSRSNTGDGPQSENPDPWDVFNLLTFDGGGVRGYWSLLVMEALMEKISEIEIEFLQHAAAGGEEAQVHHSFHPLAWQEGASRLQWTHEEKSAGQQYHSHERFRALKPAKRFLPCHYFDYIGGTSTGALIAIMLGRFRMTVPDCIHEYEKLGARIFGKPRRFCELNFPVLTERTKYDAKRLHEVFLDVTRERREDSEDARQLSVARFPSRQGVCKTFVTTVAAEYGETLNANPVSTPYLIRSYDYRERYPSTPFPTIHRPRRRNTFIPEHEIGSSRRRPPIKRRINGGHAADMEIPLVARAATAAICYFEPVKIPIREGQSMFFEDGGFGTENNPTQLGVEEIQGLHGQRRVGAVVSVGTARSDAAQSTEDRIINSIKTKLKKVLNVATSPEFVHNALEVREDLVYYRLNPNSDEHRLSIPFDEWLPRSSKRKRTRNAVQHIEAGSATREMIRQRFNGYHATSEVQQQLRECAQELVGRRQARATRDAAKWEQYALGSEFRCTEPQDSDKCHQSFPLRRDLEAHLRDVHRFSQENLKKVASERRSMTWFRYQQPS